MALLHHHMAEFRVLHNTEKTSTSTSLYIYMSAQTCSLKAKVERMRHGQEVIQVQDNTVHKRRIVVAQLECNLQHAQREVRHPARSVNLPDRK